MNLIDVLDLDLSPFVQEMLTEKQVHGVRVKMRHFSFRSIYDVPYFES